MSPGLIWPIRLHLTRSRGTPHASCHPRTTRPDWRCGEPLSTRTTCRPRYDARCPSGYAAVSSPAVDPCEPSVRAPIRRCNRARTRAVSAGFLSGLWPRHKSRPRAGVRLRPDVLAFDTCVQTGRADRQRIVKNAFHRSKVGRGAYMLSHNGRPGLPPSMRQSHGTRRVHTGLAKRLAHTRAARRRVRILTSPPRTHILTRGVARPTAGATGSMPRVPGRRASTDALRASARDLG
jgi:hypothetical protein